MKIGVIAASLTSILFYLSLGGSEPIFKDSYDTVASSETYLPKTVWPQNEQDASMAGEASGVAVGPDGDIYYLHRGSGSYGGDTFIEEPTLLVLDGKTMEVKRRLGDGLFQSPHGLEVDDRGQIWITDISLNQIFKLNAEGSVLKTFGQPYGIGTEIGLRIRNVLPNFPLPLDYNQFARPTDMTVFEDGSFAVADGYRNSRIAKFNSDGVMEWEVNQLGNESGSFNLPHGISSDGQHIYVADRDNARIQVFDHQGNHVDTWDAPELGRPYGIEVGDDGLVYVADGGDYLNGKQDDPNSQIVILNRQGKILERFGRWGTKEGELRIAHDIAVNANGDIFVAELLNERLQAFYQQ